jgi:hypothetical protein
MKRTITRRRLLNVGAQLPLVGFLYAPARAVRAQGSAPACVDPDEANDGLRKSLHYAEMSPDAKTTCSACSFFSAEKGNCGQCQIMGGAANARGHCDSWTKKS